ncbi:hypothetical protein ABG79_00214 [Caloramator mitchellensis]|uniref:Uncharacterized protein n=1 Tax=Caloramator mitchellensis TaxID=908809 RepID=A0A0R3K6J6_CALMK|nr:hypothetical protein [Caloramator mitchellensis]KRQ88047.1 hypothetical protein ABG79_00214 [Caloramator mitchellensis]
MVKISKVKWLSESALEAEVTVSDGTYDLKCFSQPFKKEQGRILNEPIYCFNNKNVVKSLENKYVVEKLSESFAYKLTGKFTNKHDCLVQLGEIIIQLEQGVIPNDIEVGEYINFYCQRLDLY